MSSPGGTGSAPASTRTVVVRGASMRYREEGGGPVVLYVHGNLGCGLWFERVMAVPGHRTVAPDLPNFGESDPIESSDIDLYGEYLIGFLDALKIDRCSLVGHSLGGAVAMSAATRRPERFDCMLLFDSCGPEGLATPEEHYPIIERYRTDRPLLRAGLSAVTPTLTDGAFFGRLVDMAARMNPASYAGNARALARFTCAERTSVFDRPVLVAVGDRDVLINAETARATAASFPVASVEMLHGVGHSVMVEDPERFVSIVVSFLARGRRGAPV